MNRTILVFTVFSVLVGILVFSTWSNTYVYAQQSSSPLPSSASKQQQDIAKIKITSPTRGQQVPVGKDITISGTSIDNTSGSTNDCKVSVRVNKISPYQPATPATGTADGGGTGAAATKTAATGDRAVKTPISSTSLQTTRSIPAASNLANKASSIGPNRS